MTETEFFDLTNDLKICRILNGMWQVAGGHGQIDYDSAIKLSCIDITRSADFGGAVVSGMDRVSLSQRVEEWKREIDEQLESLTAFEVF